MKMKMCALSEGSQLKTNRQFFQSGSPSIKLRDCLLFLISLFIENRGGGSEAFRTNFYIWCCFLLYQSKFLLGNERQKKLENFAIFTRNPRNHA